MLASVREDPAAACALDCADCGRRHYVGLVCLCHAGARRKKVSADMGRLIVARPASSAVPRVSPPITAMNPAFRFYVDQHVTFLDDPAQARRFSSAGAVLLLMRKAAFDEFVAQGVALRVVHEREGLSVTSGRVLWRAACRRRASCWRPATADGDTQNTVTFFGRGWRNCQPPARSRSVSSSMVRLRARSHSRV